MTFTRALVHKYDTCSLLALWPCTLYQLSPVKTVIKYSALQSIAIRSKRREAGRIFEPAPTNTNTNKRQKRGRPHSPRKNGKIEYQQQQRQRRLSMAMATTMTTTTELATATTKTMHYVSRIPQHFGAETTRDPTIITCTNEHSQYQPCHRKQRTSVFEAREGAI